MCCGLSFFFLYKAVKTSVTFSRQFLFLTIKPNTEVKEVSYFRRPISAKASEPNGRQRMGLPVLFPIPVVCASPEAAIAVKPYA